MSAQLTGRRLPAEVHTFKIIIYTDSRLKIKILQQRLCFKLHFRAGDVVNRGDIIAQNGGSKDIAAAGNVKLCSAHGNVTNYDDYKLVNGQKDSTGKGYYDYFGATGYTTGAGLSVKFNAALGGAYTEDKRFILSDSGTELRAPEGYLYNDLEIGRAHV